MEIDLSSFIESHERWYCELTKVTGQIMYKGVDVNTKEVDIYEMRQTDWYGFQRPNPFSKSIYDNIAFALRRHGEKNKKKLDEIVETSLKQAALWDQVRGAAWIKKCFSIVRGTTTASVYCSCHRYEAGYFTFG